MKKFFICVYLVAILAMCVKTNTKADIMEWEVQKPTGKYQIKVVDSKLKAEKALNRIRQYCFVWAATFTDNKKELNDTQLEVLTIAYGYQELWKRYLQQERYHLVVWEEFIESRKKVLEILGE